MAEELEQHTGEVEPQVEERDPQVEARRAAAMSFIRRLGDPVLKSKATPVDRFDDALRAQVARMGGVMNDALGVGLAAPQIGLSQRLLVYRVGQDAPLIALVNPEIEWTSDEEETFEEGCLSIPGINVDVDRPIHVRVKAQDETGADKARFVVNRAWPMKYDPSDLNGKGNEVFIETLELCNEGIERVA